MLAVPDTNSAARAPPAASVPRLNDGARSSKIKGINIADACSMQISDLADWVRDLDEPSVGPLLAKLLHTLDSFVEIGLGYLRLGQPATTLHREGSPVSKSSVKRSAPTGGRSTPATIPSGL